MDVDSNDRISVTLDKQANVKIMNSTNFQNYKKGKSYRFHSGLAKVSSLIIKPPRKGHRYVVINLGGYSGRVKASVKILKG